LYWHGLRSENKIFLTFDDGPTPVVTDYVLDLLEQYGFKATFFLIGDCVDGHPEIMRSIISRGHQIGNHTYYHLNAWSTGTDSYVDDVETAAKKIPSRLFRPPYGKLTFKTARRLLSLDYKLVMWDVLSGDFDSNRSAASCLRNLKKNTRNGSIVVFHDNKNFFEKLKKILPEYLDWLKTQGFESGSIAI
jgi:peptidoglycan/xylan/chitin deacetylase (PgdA/CDA1 family)